jgi:rhodanese-related sulfurtransferase
VREPTEPSLAAGAAVSRRWVTWRRQIDIADYDARFERLRASGANVHGEADFMCAFAPTSILDAGCGTGRIAIELSGRGFDVMGVDLDADMIDAARGKYPDGTWLVDDLARMQLSRRFGLIAMPGNVMMFCEPSDRLLIVHNMAQHLEPGGLLVVGFTLEPDGYTLREWDEHCAASGLPLIERYGSWERDPFVDSSSYHVSVHRRIDRFNVHDLVAEARGNLVRVTPRELFEALASGSEVVVCDTRQVVDRDADGFIEGSVHVPRSVLEWRADPASGYSHGAVAHLQQRIVVVCNDGYSSSLAAANLQRIGFEHATDLIGGFRAWIRAGLPVARGSSVR